MRLCYKKRGAQVKKKVIKMKNMSLDLGSFEAFLSKQGTFFPLVWLVEALMNTAIVLRSTTNKQSEIA